MSKRLITPADKHHAPGLTLALLLGLCFSGHACADDTTPEQRRLMGELRQLMAAEAEARDLTQVWGVTPRPLYQATEGFLAAHPDLNNRLRGEFVLVVHARPATGETEGLTPAVQALLAELVAHVPVKQAAALVADVLGLPRKALYDDTLRLRQAQDAAE